MDLVTPGQPPKIKPITDTCPMWVDRENKADDDHAEVKKPEPICKPCGGWGVRQEAD